VKARRRSVVNSALFVATILSLGGSRGAGAQFFGGEPRPPRSATVAVFGSNVLLGALTATTHALFAHEDPFKAFTIGALGGAVHFAGKAVGTGPGIPSGVAGLALASAGTSVIANAGAGKGLLSDLYMPVGPLRLRWRPMSTSVRVGFNVFDAAIIARNLARPGLRVDWDRTAATGALVFVAPERLVENDGEILDGITAGPVVVIAGYARDPNRTFRHEVVHVKQIQFFDETWGKPVDDYVRTHVRLLSWLPPWVELGLTAPALIGLESAVFGKNGPFRRLSESEADILEYR